MCWPNVLNKSLLAFQVACVVWDVGFGTYDIYRHKYVLAAWMFGLAGFQVAIMVWRARSRRVGLEMVRHLAQLESRQMGPEAILKARANLQRVMEQTGAEAIVHRMHGRRIRMVVGKDVFLLAPSTIIKSCVGETCYVVAGPMPDEEKMATAMLLLRHNPALWDRWLATAGMETFCA